MSIPPKAPPWGARPLIVLRGGARDGWWYFADDFATQIRAAERSGITAPPYAPTTEQVAHPTYDCTGTVWRHTPRKART